MDDASWADLTKVFPRLLKGARIEPGALTSHAGKQPPFICGAFSPDDRFVALSGGGRIPSHPVIWVARAASLEPVVTLRGHQGLHDLAWHSESGLLASSSNDYTVALWDIERRDHVFVTGGDGEPIVKNRVAFAQRALFIGEGEAFQDHSARLLRASLDDGRVEPVHTLSDAKARLAITRLAVEPDTERWAFVSDDFDYRGRATLACGRGVGGDVEKSELDVDVLALRWRDGRLALAAIDDDGLEIRIAGDRRRIEAKPDRAAFSHDGRLICLAEGTRVMVVDVAEGRTVWSVEIQGTNDDYQTTLLAWSPSGALVAVAGFGGLAILDGGSGKIVKSAPPPLWFAGP